MQVAIALTTRIPDVGDWRPVSRGDSTWSESSSEAQGVEDSSGGPAANEKTYSSPERRAAMNADCGISTLPNCRIRFLPAFCFSNSLRLRVTSPP